MSGFPVVVLFYYQNIAMSTVTVGNMSSFNMQHGYSEALVHGYKSGFLKDQDYRHLCQCETLEGLFFLS